MQNAGPSAVRQLRFVVASWKEDQRTDAELLARFVQSHDEQAFTTLVGRHSELVWGVCLRVLRNGADAEDALQATFLRLARDAKRVLQREAVGGWLFRAARDCAIDLHRSIARQRRIEARVAEVANRGGSPDVPSDLRLLLDDELALLPRSESAVLVLCCLEGRTYADAALELGCSVAAVHRRLVRAQTRLRRKFARHGSAALGALAAVFTGAALPAASAAPPFALARAVGTGLATARERVPPPTRAGALAAAGARGSVGAVGVGAVVLLGALAVFAPRLEVAVAPGAEPTVERRGPESVVPVTVVTGVVRGPADEPVAGATVAVLARQPFRPGERGLRDRLVATVTADGAGRFAVPVPDDFETWFADRVVTVQASGPNLALATTTVRLLAPEPVELALKPAVPLRGRLVDAAGRPAAGVRLEVARVGNAVAEAVVGRAGSRPPAWPLPVTSAADGTFAVPGLGGSTNVWVRVSDPRFALDTFRLDGSGAARYSLAPARPLVIEVRDAETGRPLPGASVTVITDAISAHPHFCAADHGVLGPVAVPADLDAVTDARGRVRVNLAPGDRAEVLVHPPAGDVPYLGARVRRAAGETGAEERLVVPLRRGRWVTGTVCGRVGRPLAGAAVHWARATGACPEWRDEVLSGRDALTRTGPDGVFRLAMPPGACEVRAYGPSADYESTPGKLPGTASGTIYAHHNTALDVPATGDVSPLRIVLRAALTAHGEIAAPATGSSTFFVCAGRVSAVRAYSVVPLAVRDNTFAVPGCRAGRTARVYLLDPVAKLGAVADVAPGAPAPAVKLLPCGALRVRVREADGRPSPNRSVHVSLLAERDRRAGGRDAPAADPQPVEWFDAVNYPGRPRTNADGVAELPALVPGARYALAVGSGTNRVTVGTFLIEPGRTVAAPEVTLPVRSERGVP